MGLNLKIYFKSNPDNIYFYDSGYINTEGKSGNIKFKWQGLNIDTSMSISDFKQKGFVITNTEICYYQVTIESDVDIMIGCSNSSNVYRVDGSLPFLGGLRNEIPNFDKICLPLFDTSKVLSITSDLMINNRGVRRINYFFSDHREWRSSDENTEGNKLIDIPEGLFTGFGDLIELMCFNRMDNIISVPENNFAGCVKLEAVRAFNDCKRLSNIFGAKITSSKIRYIIAFNNLQNNCLIPSGLVSSGGNGSLMCYLFNNCNSENKKISFEEILNVPNKRVCFMTGLSVDLSKSSKTHNGLYVEYGESVVSKVSNDDELVGTWKDFFNNKVLPALRDNNDFNDVEDIYTINLV